MRSARAASSAKVTRWDSRNSRHYFAYEKTALNDFFKETDEVQSKQILKRPEDKQADADDDGKKKDDDEEEVIEVEDSDSDSDSEHSDDDIFAWYDEHGLDDREEVVAAEPAVASAKKPPAVENPVDQSAGTN